MSKARHYTLEESQVKQQRISQRQAYLSESAKRAAARERMPAPTGMVARPSAFATDEKR